MRVPLRLVAAALVFATVGCASSPAPTAPPVTLRLTTEPGEFQAPLYVPLRILTTDVNGEPAAVPHDTPVTLADTFGTSTTLTVPAGASSAVFLWAARVGGLYRLKATADGLPAASILLPIRASATPEVSTVPQFPTGTITQPTTPTWSDRIFKQVPPVFRREDGGGSIDVVYRSDTPVPGTDRLEPFSFAPEVGATIAPPAVIVLDVTPNELFGTEQAQATVTLRTASNGLATADRDIRVQFSSAFATISTREVTIPAKSSSSIATPVAVSAARPGEDRISAVAAFGTDEKPVKFRPALPTRVAIVPSPAASVADGRTEVSVSVRLIDDSGKVRNAPADTVVAVSTSLGTLGAPSVTIPKDRFNQETTLTSTRHGTATVSGSAAGLADGAAALTFAVPWLLALIAGIGGVAGAYVRDRQDSTTRRLIQNLVIGAILGVMLWAVVMFGALRAIEALPLDLLKVPAANEIGCLLLGFVGGYYGRTLWDRGEALAA